jgi:flagellar basal-body rod protein FlgC
MSNLPIFDVAGSAMQAQSVRLNTVASNMANADSVSGNPDETFRAKLPVFQAAPVAGQSGLSGVRVLDVVESQAPAVKRYEPGHPMADGDGYVYAPDIDPVSQMVDLISASRGYQANVEVFNTAKELAVATLTMGR